MLPDFRTAVIRTLAIAGSVAIGAFAVYELALSARYSSYMTLDALLDRRQPVSPQVLDTYASRLVETPATCRSDIVEAAVTVATYDTDRKTWAGDRPAWIASLKISEQVLRHGLSCMPTHGIFWSQLAAVRWSLGGTAQEQAALLTMAQAYNPSELQAIENRFFQWRIISPKVATLAAGAMQSDIRNILLYASLPAAKRILANMPPGMLAVARNEAALVPPKRLDALRGQGLVSN